MDNTYILIQKFNSKHRKKKNNITLENIIEKRIREYLRKNWRNRKNKEKNVKYLYASTILQTRNEDTELVDTKLPTFTRNLATGERSTEVLRRPRTSSKLSIRVDGNLSEGTRRESQAGKGGARWRWTSTRTNSNERYAITQVLGTSINWPVQLKESREGVLIDRPRPSHG